MLRFIASALLFTSVFGQEVCNDYKSCVDRCFAQGNSIFPSQRTQGAPGKRGPQGPPGPQGRPGPTGQCECQLNGVNAALSELKQKLETALEFAAMGKFLYCSLGVKLGGVIPDNSFSQNARYHSNGKGDPRHGRLNVKGSESSYGSWIPHKPRLGQWIQVDLGSTKIIHGIVTQGRDKVHQWVKTYSVQYGTTTQSLKDVLDENGNKQIFTGNVDKDNYASQTFSPPLTTRFVRIYPLTWHGYPSFRFDLLSC